MIQTDEALYRVLLPKQLEIETASTCNRACVSCLRNSDPDRAAVAPWFEQTLLPTATVARLFDEALAMGFSGPVCLQHYNEPLLDPRIAVLGRMAKERGFSRVYVCTNGDLLTEDKVAELDGNLDDLVVSTYAPAETGAVREEWLRARFKTTRLTFTGGSHVPTHFNPCCDALLLAAKHHMLPCHEPPRRLIVNHRGDMLFCCDDMTGRFALGNVADVSLFELWYDPRHVELMLALQLPGGRAAHTHCHTCPRGCY